jgi:hypothetical protein
VGCFRAVVIPALVACALGPDVADAYGQTRPPAITPPPSDTTRQRIVVRPNRGRGHRERGFRRDPLPAPAPDVVASAFRDAPARDAITAARIARWRQDSTLTSYDATVKQRMSAGLNVKAIGRDRLLLRTEVAARVRWSRPNRVSIDVQGARTAVPASFPGAKALTGFAQLVPIPYFAGSERLMWWMNLDGDEDNDGDDENPFAYVHPLDEGAEHVYQYRSGESATIRLPGGRDIVLREVIVTAREPAPDLINGSLWFDEGDGQLVRAAFRPASPLDMLQFIGEDSFDDVPAPIRASLLTPFTFEVESFTIDYGLYGERWWLPRSQTARGHMRIGFMRSTATIDQLFRYTEVNGRDTLASMPAMRRRFERELGDDVGQIVGSVVDGVVPGDQFRRERRRRGFECEPGDTTTGRQRRGSLRIAIRIPCDSAALVNSPELPPSIFDEGEEEFGLADARALAEELDAALPPLGASSQTARTTVSYGWRNGLLRYNRVEGLSAALLAERPLGRGWTGTGLVRLGSGDLEPNVTLGATRGTDRRRFTMAAYHRLESANDWGDPFGLGGSLSALLFGRDEGYYYRSSGAELTGTRAPSPGTSVTWRLFAERQHNAPVETHLSLPNAFRGARFEPNVTAIPATAGGVAARLRGTHGLDPRGFRLSADVRAEAAAGTFDYTRIAGDFTATQGLVRDAAVSLTLGAGTSGGTVSPQRLWHLGGTHTVRGFGPGTLSGDSYWLARAELGLGGRVFKPVLFYDAGWAGARDGWSKSRGNIRGAGGGVSFMDGLARVDLARGVNPRSEWRAHLYVEAAF